MKFFDLFRCKTFKSEPIKSKLLKTLPGLQKNQIWGIDVSGMFVGKKEITVSLLFNLWKFFIRFKIASDLSHTNLQKPLFSAQSSLAPSHPYSDS